MRTVFHSPVWQKQFEQRGYVLQPGLLDKSDIEKLLALFDKFRTDYTAFFHTTHFNTDIEQKRLVHQTISAVVFPKVAPLLHNFTPLFANFMIKNADPLNPMDMHADWTYVDETKFSSISVWSPLVDVNEENGCLGIVEGSHKIANDIRGPLIRQSTRDHERDWEKKYGLLLPMKAGDVILYNHRLLHYSPPNRSASVRPAINLSIAPAEAPIIHYCMPEGATEIRMYSVPDSEFYIRYNHFQQPQTDTLIKSLPANTVRYMDHRMKNFGWKRLMARGRELLFQ